MRARWRRVRRAQRGDKSCSRNRSSGKRAGSAIHSPMRRACSFYVFAFEPLARALTLRRRLFSLLPFCSRSFSVFVVVITYRIAGSATHSTYTRPAHYFRFEGDSDFMLPYPFARRFAVPVEVVTTLHVFFKQNAYSVSVASRLAGSRLPEAREENSVPFGASEKFVQ